MPGSEPVILATIVASLSSLAAQALARLRWRCVPDEHGNTRCLSGCSDVPLEHKDEHELDRGGAAYVFNPDTNTLVMSSDGFCSALGAVTLA